MNKGNDILSSQDIVNGTKDHLKGTHVYEIHIDRSKEPNSASTWNGISKFGEFTFVYNTTQCTAIDVREQTSKCNGKATRFNRNKLFKLWPNYLKLDTISTGVTSDSNDTDESDVEPRFLKKAKPKEKTQPTEVMVAHSRQEAERESACPKCGKQFLRIGCLKKHINSNLCSKSTITSRTNKQLRESLPVNAALGFAKEVRKLEAPKNMHNDTNAIGQSLFNKLLQQSARKECSKQSKRFTLEQKEIMETCFEEGELDKKKRYTVSKCRELLRKKLGEELTLTEQQIASYWSAHKRRKIKLKK